MNFAPRPSTFTNTPQFNTPVRNVSSSTFGEITGAQGERNIQLALKYSF